MASWKITVFDIFKSKIYGDYFIWDIVGFNTPFLVLGNIS